MKVEDVLKLLKEDMYDYELKMSCMELDYTRENPNSADCGYLYNDCDCATFEIDWNHKIKTKVAELFAFGLTNDLISWDCDDGNIIDFKDIIIDNKNKQVILV